MTWRRAMAASLLGALERPVWWLLALASFLLRGGLLVFLLPIVILPTPAGLANAFAAEITGFAFGSPSGAFISAVIVATVALTGWLLVGGLVAAWTDVALVATVAGDRVGREVTGWAGLAWRALAIRLTSQIPLAIALAWGVTRIVDAVYTEYLRPGDLSLPLVLRVALRIPDVVALIGVTWAAGETAGGLGLRHLVLGRRSTPDALARGWLDLATRPSVLTALALVTGAWILIAIPVAGAAGETWNRVRTALGGDDPRLIVGTLTAFVATWLAGIVAVAIVEAWRSSAWTLEVARRERVPVAPPPSLPVPATPAREGAGLGPDGQPLPAPQPAARLESLASPLEPIAPRHAEGGEPV
jgi:hypothetical protein